MTVIGVLFIVTVICQIWVYYSVGPFKIKENENNNSAIVIFLTNISNNIIPESDHVVQS